MESNLFIKNMKCHQCNNNAMYLIGDANIPLCLACYSLVQQNQQRKQDMLAEEMNYLSDTMDAIV